MAAINFPNPGTQTPPNTFSPNSAPAKTKNGITYTWNGVGWVIRSTTGGGGDGGFSQGVSPNDANDQHGKDGTNGLGGGGGGGSAANFGGVPGGNPTAGNKSGSGGDGVVYIRTL